MLRAVAEARLERRILGHADRHGLGAPGVEPAAGRRRDGRGHVADQDDLLPLVGQVRVGDGHRGQQRTGIGMTRDREKLVRGRDLRHLAEVHDRDGLADVAHHGKVVRDEDVGEPEVGLQVDEQVDDLRLDGDVEGRHRLVADDQLRAEGERPGHPDALPLAAGELRREPVEVLRVEPHPLHQLLHEALALRARGQAVDRVGVSDDRPDPAARVQRSDRVLEDHLDLRAQRPHAPLGELGDVPAVEDDPAGGDIMQPGDAPGQGRLAASGLADDAERLPARHRQAHAVNGVHVFLLAEHPGALDREVLDQVLHPQQHVIAVGGSRGGYRAGFARRSGCHIRPHAPAGPADLASSTCATLRRTASRSAGLCGSQQADRWLGSPPTGSSAGISSHLSMT